MEDSGRFSVGDRNHSGLASDPVPPPAAPQRVASPRAMSVNALLLGERLDTRVLESRATVTATPMVMPVDGGGTAVLFRYGAVVLFDVPEEARAGFLAMLQPHVTESFATAEAETLRLLVRPDSDQVGDAAGNIVLREVGLEHLQLVADILAKNLVLAHYETRIAGLFDRIEPLAAILRQKGRAGAPGKELLQHIGDVLLIQQKMVGRVETGESPELVWEHPELDRLYMRLAEEYELRDRSRALDRKLDVVARTVETLLGLVQTRSSMRVEWYIVILIVAELLLAAYSLLAPH